MEHTHCQVCGREIKAKSGRIAHHGYKRPGNGWQTASCFGAKAVPYEVGHDALDAVIKHVTAYKCERESYLARFQAEPPAVIEYNAQSDPWANKHGVVKLVQVARPEDYVAQLAKGYDYDRKSYTYQFRLEVQRVQRDIATAEDNLKFFGERRAAWTAPAA